MSKEPTRYCCANGIIKEDIPFACCGRLGHSECAKVRKIYPCGCVEEHSEHFNGKKITASAEVKHPCKEHRVKRVISEATREKIIDTCRELWKKRLRKHPKRVVRING